MREDFGTRLKRLRPLTSPRRWHILSALSTTYGLAAWACTRAAISPLANLQTSPRAATRCAPLLDPTRRR